MLLESLLLLLLELLLGLLLLELLELLLELLLLLLELLSLRLLLLSELRSTLLEVLSSFLSTSRRACAWAVVDGDKAVKQKNSNNGAMDAPVNLLSFLVLIGCLRARPAPGQPARFTGRAVED